MHANIYPIGPGSPQPPDQDESIRRYGIIVEEPGTEYYYSNFGYGIIDRVIAAVSGKSYAEFMATEVFAPLGMTHTSVMIDSSLAEHVVRNYDENGRPVPLFDYDHRGASAAYSSVHDLLRYGMFHLKNALADQRQIISDETIDLTHQPSELRMPDQGPAETRVGLGWAVTDLSGETFLGASGGMPGTVTRLALIPAKNVAVAIVVNSGSSDGYDAWELEWETFRALLPDFPPKPEIPQPKTDRSPFPTEAVGEWVGTVTTYEGDLPARLSIGSALAVSLTLAGQATTPIPVETPLGVVEFKDGVFQGPFFGAIPTADARRGQHVVFLRLRLRDEVLYGYIAAVAVDQTFILPNWMELKKVPE
jgi:CubicO group peptidase (beta-lactamase class C family)